MLGRGIGSTDPSQQKGRTLREEAKVPTMRTTGATCVILAALVVLAIGKKSDPTVTYTKVEAAEKTVVAAPKKIVVEEVSVPPLPPPTKKVVVEDPVESGKKAGSVVVVESAAAGKKGAKPVAMIDPAPALDPTPTPAPLDGTPSGRRGGGRGGGVGGVAKILKSKVDLVKSIGGGAGGSGGINLPFGLGGN
ncbi:hypothetical protein BSKO_03230 [Bryopsis sp. KO-2023]|nr:hypothetical protein BSKO_03230 [Bryopsis sp. KO-2023]